MKAFFNSSFQELQLCFYAFFPTNTTSWSKMTLIWALFCPQKCRNCPQINDNYFYSIFHHEKDLLSKKFAKGAHSGMFLAFRIYINFHSIFRIVSDTMILLPKTLGAIWEHKVVFFHNFQQKIFGTFFSNPICTMKESF